MAAGTRRKYRNSQVERLIAAFGLAVLTFAATSRAGILQNNGAVGGVRIDAQGVLENLEPADQREIARLRREAIAANEAGDLAGFANLRKVSLRKLEEALAAHHADRPGKPLPLDLQLLAGLQQIHYVFVYPEEKDLVLVGPAEGWKALANGEIVGATTGRAVMKLDDLLTGLRSGGRNDIQCSIDPTPAGLKQLQTVAGKLERMSPSALTAIETAMGPQVITVGGVPESSHFAQVMVAADYRMKRLAMNFDRAPIEGMPSFLELSKAGSGGMETMLPRWWLAPKADPLLVSEDGLAFQLRNLGVECKTEQDFLAADGSRKQTGAGALVAKKWANNFTAKYDELSKAEPIFGQLRNLMDLAVVGALVHREQLFERAGLQAPYLLGEEALDVYAIPKQVAAKSTFVKKGKNYLISVSGGVQIAPHAIVEARQTSVDVAEARTQSAGAPTQWWRD